MRLVDNDRWAGEMPLTRNRRHRYTIEAWRDEFGTWRSGLLKKVEARTGGAERAARGERSPGGRGGTRQPAAGRGRCTFGCCAPPTSPKSVLARACRASLREPRRPPPS